ncbi:hypothetical protein PVK06_003449 [Gossypium arboreum]|uniref:KNOX1 domain-containing protein n=1 Tax=Gossypium arboreum TaxID=29729 RepID=A0ABR0R7F7_GOSAR|nr:hypothetical protein PVK06_003449 [Gossypium arboreum]
MQEPGGLGMMSSGGGSETIGGLSSGEVSVTGDQNRHLKAEIATHPLYEQLLAAHVSCLRVATPIDQLSLIDAQLAESHNILRSYASQQQGHSLSPHERQELDNFLVSSSCFKSIFFFFSCFVFCPFEKGFSFLFLFVV